MSGYYQYPPHTNGYSHPPQYANGYVHPPHPQAGHAYPPQQPGGWGYPAAPSGQPPMHQQQQQQQQQPAGPPVPQQEAVQPHEHDVLMGRGGKNNQHAGNERLRDFAREIRDAYRASAKKGKSNMSRDLVQRVRDLTPPGRFLKRSPITNDWEDVGDDIAREKVSQVLRDAVSEYCGPKAAAAAAAIGDEGETKEATEDPAAKAKEIGAPDAATSDPATVPEELKLQEPSAPNPALVSRESLESLEPISSEPTSDEIAALVLSEADDFLAGMDDSAKSNSDGAADEPVTPTTPTHTSFFNAKTRRPSNVPVQAVPWNRNKRKTNLLDRYGTMNKVLSNSDMSIGSMGSQLSSRNLGKQLSGRQLMSTGARQMSSRQLSSRQLSRRQLGSSGRQLGGRQQSGRQIMSLDHRKQNFAMMGDSDLSLESLSISGVSGHTNKSRSRKNIFMQQYQDMDMGLSDFSLNSLASPSTHLPTTAHDTLRPSVIIEGDLEELSDHGSAHKNPAAAPEQFMDQYAAAGIGTSISNMTMNSVGTFSGHSRMSRGLFSMGNSMRMDSVKSFLTIDELQLDMLDDELFDEFAGGDLPEGDEDCMEDGDEFSSEFC